MKWPTMLLHAPKETTFLLSFFLIFSCSVGEGAFFSERKKKMFLVACKRGMRDDDEKIHEKVMIGFRRGREVEDPFCLRHQPVANTQSLSLRKQYT